MKKNVLFSMLFFVPLFIMGQQNLLKVNSDFELGTQKGWAYNSIDAQYISVNSDAALDSKYGLKVSLGDNKAYIYSNPNDGVDFKIEKDKKYRFEFMMKMVSKGSGALLTVNSLTGYKPGDIQIHRDFNKSPLNEWTKISMEFTGQDIPTAKFSLLINKGEYYFDNFKLCEI